MLKLLRRLFVIGLLAAAAYALWKKLAGTGDVATFADVRSDLGAPAPPVVVAPAPGPEPMVSGAWVEPDDGGHRALRMISRAALARRAPIAS